MLKRMRAAGATVDASARLVSIIVAGGGVGVKVGVGEGVGVGERVGVGEKVSVGEKVGVDERVGVGVKIVTAEQGVEQGTDPVLGSASPAVPVTVVNRLPL